ncbi:MAG: BON domain-containing protein, partial [Myxococcales bacterium]|nr:BON domain-containing protein [Myxococcales bacterium]
MGLFSFVQDVGRKIGLFGGRAAAEADAAKAQAEAALAEMHKAVDEATRKRAQEAATAADIRAAILSYVDIEALAVAVEGTRATVQGTAKAQVDQEKAVLVAGNTEGIAEVDDQLVVVVPEPPAVFRTVVKGDTLSKIAKEFYGNAMLYNVIFEANRP